LPVVAKSESIRNFRDFPDRKISYKALHKEPVRIVPRFRTALHLLTGYHNSRKIYHGKAGSLNNPCFLRVFLPGHRGSEEHRASNETHNTHETECNEEDRNPGNYERDHHCKSGQGCEQQCFTKIREGEIMVIHIRFYPAARPRGIIAPGNYRPFSAF
jgi:hypothetical protein